MVLFSQANRCSDKPNGSLGPAVVRHASKAGFDITLLTRDVDATAKAFPASVKPVKADYTSAESLASVLQTDKFDSLVMLTNRDQVDAQMKLIDAAVLAGIPHIIPSAFGIDNSDPEIREWPIFNTKAQLEDYLHAKADEGHVTFTAINTGIFLDYALERGMMVSLNDDKPTPIFDGGETPVSVSVVDDIGAAVAAALLKRDKLRNKTLCMQSAGITQNEVIRYARDADPTREFNTIALDTAVMVEKAKKKMRNGESGPDVTRPFMARVSFGEGKGLFKNLDNEVLGIKEWSEEQVKRLVADYVLRPKQTKPSTTRVEV